MFSTFQSKSELVRQASEKHINFALFMSLFSICQLAPVSWFHSNHIFLVYLFKQNLSLELKILLNSQNFYLEGPQPHCLSLDRLHQRDVAVSKESNENEILTTSDKWNDILGSKNIVTWKAKHDCFV